MQEQGGLLKHILNSHNQYQPSIQPAKQGLDISEFKLFFQAREIESQAAREVGATLSNESDFSRKITEQSQKLSMADVDPEPLDPGAIFALALRQK